MGAFLGFIFGVYFVGVFLTWPYFWARKTDRSMDPFVRRLTGLMWALAWPFHITMFFRGRAADNAAKSEREAASSRILGGGAPASPAPGPSTAAPAVPVNTTSSVANPFDN